MRLRRVPPARVIGPMIKAIKAGLRLTINELEAHYLAGGNVERVVNALIAADKAEHRPRPSSAPPPSTWPAATCSRPCR